MIQQTDMRGLLQPCAVEVRAHIWTINKPPLNVG